MAPLLGYWNFRGLAEPIRYILHYKGIEFIDKRYETSEKEWYNEKFNLDLDFPNLPYFVDGDLRVSQSTCIIRYLARKYDLDGSSELEKVKMEMVEQQLLDLRLSFLMTCCSANYETDKCQFLKTVSVVLKQWVKFLDGKKFLFGDEPTYVDFIAYDIFDFLELFDTSIYEEFPKLKEYLQNFRNIPQLHSYLNSKTYVKWPIMGLRLSKFGVVGEEPKRQ